LYAVVNITSGGFCSVFIKSIPDIKGMEISKKIKSTL
jgi:hypothetical protein